MGQAARMYHDLGVEEAGLEKECISLISPMFMVLHELYGLP